MMMVASKYIHLPRFRTIQSPNDDIEMVTNRIPLENGTTNAESTTYYQVNKYIIATVICCGFAGIASELFQKIASHNKRSFDVYDIYFDMMGSGCGIIAAYLHESYSNRISIEG